MARANRNPPPLASVFILVLCGVVIFEYFYYRYSAVDVQEPSSHLKKSDEKVSRRAEPDNTGTVCGIPETPFFFGPWLPSKWKPKEKFRNCSRHYKKLFNVSDSGILTLLPPYKDCCIQDIIPGRNDAEYKFSECKQVSSGMSIRNTETFVVRCGNETNFDAWLPDFPAVTEKIKFWRENFPRVEDRPYSVFIFGFDSISRAHAYRSIPKSLKMMTDELNFTDFKHYHAVDGHSFLNMLAFLAGVNKKDMVKYAKLAFHESPVISNKYNARNYVTKGLLTGKNGFIKIEKRPVDYHARLLLMALEEAREEEERRFNDSRRPDCLTSTESEPDFALRYSLQFLKKFSDIPFFNFDWLDKPFHDDENYLSNFEDFFLRFLQALQREKQVLRRSLIIFLTDHGYGHLSYDIQGSESFIQRRLPALFIRLPDALVEEHPVMLASLKSNSGRLTTPFDVHHTLEHFLALKDSFNAKSKGGNPLFVPSWQNRSSFLVPIPPNRTCSTVQIPPQECLCDVIYNPNSKFHLPTAYGEKALALATSRLIAMVKEYEFGHLCEPWSTMRMRAKGPPRLVLDDYDYKQLLISFEATKMNGTGFSASFEARVFLLLQRNDLGKEIGITGDVLILQRIDSYKAYVDCLPQGTMTDADMREFCICRDVFLKQSR